MVTIIAMSIFVAVLSALSLALSFWASFRQKYVYKMDRTEINNIVRNTHKCSVLYGAFSTKSKTGLPATIKIENDETLILLNTGEKLNFNIEELRKVDDNGVGWLTLYPNSSKKFAIADDGRIGIFFSDSKFARFHAPLFFLPGASSTRKIDKIAVAYYLYISEKLKSSKV